MHGEERGGAAFLPGGRVSVLVALPGHVWHVLGAGVWSQDLPIEARVFQFDFSAGYRREVFPHHTAARELGQAGVAVHEDPLGVGALPVEVVEVGAGQAAVVGEANKFLKDQGYALIDVNQWAITHKEGSHDLHRWSVEPRP